MLLRDGETEEEFLPRKEGTRRRTTEESEARGGERG